MEKIDKLVRPNIKKMKAYSSARDEYSTGEGVFLDANEYPEGRFNRYPDPMQKELKAILAKRLNISPSMLCIGNGSDEILDLIFRVFCRPGKDKILNLPPTYGMYEVLAKLNDLEIVEIQRGKEFEIKTIEILEKIKLLEFRVLILCSPNNPTGNSTSIFDVQKILENFKGILIIDEAYVEYDSDQNFLSLITKYPNLVLCRTFSKAWALAGARVGYSISSPAITDYLNKLKAPYNVSVFNQQLALEALSKTPLKQNIKEQLILKEKLITQLLALKNVIKVYPSKSNFLLVKFRNSAYVFQELLKAQIIVRNQSEKINNCLRITVGTPTENEQLIKQLNNLEK